jgi:hypothetical protein
MLPLRTGGHLDSPAFSWYVGGQFPKFGKNCVRYYNFIRGHPSSRLLPSPVVGCLGRAPVPQLIPISLNADKLRGSEFPETLGMCTEGRSEGGKDRMQFRFLRRQSFCAEFTDAIFQSAVHGTG